MTSESLPTTPPLNLSFGTSGLKSLCNGVIDKRRALFLEQVNLSLFLFDERVNLYGLAVKEIRDGLLFRERRKRNSFIEI